MTFDGSLPVIVPPSVGSALQSLDAMERDLDAAETYEQITKLERAAEALKKLFKEVDEVQVRAGRVVVLANYRIGEEIKKLPVAKGSRGQLSGKTKGTGAKGKGKAPPVSGGDTVSPPETTPTLADAAGYKKKGQRLKQLASHPKEAVKAATEDLAKSGKDITVNGVIKALAAGETKKKREASRSAPALLDGLDFRTGDCRKVLSNIPDASVPLILTDPPYGDEAEPLYEWLADWSSRVLIPGGSLIVYTGQSRLNRDMRIFDEKLRYWWLLIMQHHQSQRLAGKFVIANFKPVLWYVKDHRRGRTLMPDVLKSPERDKSLHNWAQGEGGVSQLIEHLTEPGDLVVDPFAGTGTWGKICTGMGRRWIGADLEAGGTTNIAAE